MTHNYNNYADWKDWKSNDFAVLSSESQKSFDFLFQNLKISPSGKKILEIGFGNGDFIAYSLAESCCSIEGVELQENLLQRAKAKGLTVFSSISQISNDEKYDMIFAFNVLEHLNADQLLELFLFLDKSLTKGGVCVFEFPNGESFFSMGMQNGDITHVSSITRQKLFQLMSSTTLKLKYWAPAFHHIQLLQQNPVKKNHTKVLQIHVCEAFRF